jgi:membrane-associated phospholipid phosphatase
MDINTEYGAVMQESISLVGWEQRLARLVSGVFSPPLMALVGIGLAAAAIGTPQGWAWSAFYTFTALALPLGYILWQVRRGKISDFHMQKRGQRVVPMLLMMACSLAAWLVMWQFEAPQVLTVFAGAGIFQIGLLLVVTTRWKISGHGTAIASLAVLLIALFGRWAAPVALAVPLVVWARVRLRRHTPGQTIAGALVGAAFMLVVLYGVA